MITKLTKKGITIKIVSGNYHREVGLCEQAVYNIKQLIINTFCNKVITSILDFQHMCGLIEFFINRRPTLNLDDRLVARFTCDEIFIERSNIPLLSDKVFSNVVQTYVKQY